MYKEPVSVIRIFSVILFTIDGIVNCFVKGLTLLKVRVAVWRYDRGTRSLEQNLLSSEPKTLETLGVNNVDDDDDDDVSTLLEDIIQELMEGLKDTDIIVR